MTTKPQDNLRNGEPCPDGVTCVVSIAAAEEAAAHIDSQDAKIKALVEALEGFKGSITKAALDSESGREIVDICFSAHCDAALAAAKETPHGNQS